MLLGAYLMPHPPVMVKEVGKGNRFRCMDTIDGATEIAKRIADLEPETIVVITPHGPVFSDGLAISTSDELYGDFENFGCNELKFKYDNDVKLAEAIVNNAFDKGILMAEIDQESAVDFNITTHLDHGALVPLYFINEKLNQFKIVHITYGMLSHEKLYEFGISIQNAIVETGKKVVVVASGDLSHRLKDDGPYEYHEAGPKYDACIVDLMTNRDVQGIFSIDTELEKNAGECGRRSIDIMLGTLEGFASKNTLINYEGPFGVGYGLIAYEHLEKADSEYYLDRIYKVKEARLSSIRSDEDAYVKLARQVVEHAVNTGERLRVEPTNLPREMIDQRAGTFVSIKTDNGLRGCIGTIGPTEKHILDEIISNGIKAATQDPRFSAITPDELEGLIITVDVLETPEVIEDKSLLDPHNYGVIVTQDYRRGVLLPNLDGIDTVDEQLRVVLNKAGISTGSYQMERFLVTRHK